MKKKRDEFNVWRINEEGGLIFKEKDATKIFGI